MSSAGRTTTYNDAYASQARELCAEHGYSGRKLAKFFKVAPSTIVYWKGQYEDFAEAVKEGQAAYDEILMGEVETAMVKMALGGKRKQQKKERNENGRLVVVDEKVTEVPPNAGMLKFIATNRDPIRWKNRVDATVDASVLNKNELSPELKELNERLVNNGNKTAGE